MTSLYPEFEVSLLSANEYYDGSNLSHNLASLDQILASAGLAPLSAFIDARTMALEVLEEYQLPENCPAVQWYLAQEGLTAIQGLLMHYHQTPEEVIEPRSALVVELKHLEALLKQAEAEGAKFHLLVGI